MPTLTLAAAAALAVVATVAPNASAGARPPVRDWPLGFTCLMGMNASSTDAETYEFQTMAGPLVPVTDAGEVVSDITIRCTIDVTPAAHPAAHLESVGVNVGGAVAGPPDAEIVTTGSVFTVTQCSHLTWTDSSGTPRTGGSCRTKDYDHS